MEPLARHARNLLILLTFSAVILSCDDDGFSPSGPSVCGNGVVEEGESCDSSDLAGQDCISLGYYGGTLGCTSYCEFDVTSCMEAGYCGDGTIQEDQGEECEGSSSLGITCQDLGLQGTAELRCNPATCRIDRSPCPGDATSQLNCGNGEVNDGELCDGSCPDYGIMTQWGGCTSCTSCTYLMHFASQGDDYGYRTSWAGVGDVYYILGLSEDKCHVLKMENGLVLWDVRLTDTPCYPGDILADALGIFVSFSEETTDGYAGKLMKLDTNGTQMWVRPVPYASYSNLTSLVMYDGLLYVAGYSDTDAWGPGRGGFDMLLGSITPTSGEWQDRYQFGTSGDDFVYQMLMDDAGSYYFTAMTSGDVCAQGNSGSYDGVVFKSNVQGLVWCHQFGSQGDDALMGMTLDDGGTLYAVGYTTSALFSESMGHEDGIAVALDAATGEVRWSVQAGTASSDLLYGVHVFENGTVGVLGPMGDVLHPTQDSSSYPDISLMFLDGASGEIRDVLPILQGDGPEPYASFLVQSPSPLHGQDSIRLVVTGSTQSHLLNQPGGGYDGFLLIQDRIEH